MVLTCRGSNETGTKMKHIFPLAAAVAASLIYVSSTAYSQDVLEVLCDKLAPWDGEKQSLPNYLEEVTPEWGRYVLMDVTGGLHWSSDPELANQLENEKVIIERMIHSPEGVASVPVFNRDQFDLGRLELRWNRCRIGEGAVILAEGSYLAFVPDAQNPFTGRWLGAVTGRKRYGVGEDEFERIGGSLKGILFQNGQDCAVELFGLKDKWEMDGVVIGNVLRTAGKLLEGAKGTDWTWALEYDAEEDVVRGTVTSFGQGAHYDLSVYLERYQPDNSQRAEPVEAVAEPQADRNGENPL